MDELGREKLNQIMADGRGKLGGFIKPFADEEVTKEFFTTQFEKVYHFNVAELQDRAFADIIE